MLAEALHDVAAVIGEDHVWRLTPRQLLARCELERRRQGRQMKAQLAIMRAAHHAKPEDVKRLARDLES